MMNVAKHLWRALRRHVEKGHTLRVHLVGDGSDHLQVSCVFCGIPILAGSPSIVNTICTDLLEVGVKVVKPSTQPQVRLQ